MRKLALLIAVLAALTPVTAQAADRPSSVTKTSRAWANPEVWADGSSGSGALFFDIHKPEIGADWMVVSWNGQLPVDGPLEWAQVDWEGPISEDLDNRYGQRKLESAHLRFFDPDGHVYLPGRFVDREIGSGLTVRVRWEGYGSVRRRVIVYPDGLRVIEAVRAATVTGSFSIGGVPLPSSDFTMGRGSLERRRMYPQA